ncbi:hypothetical protein Undi14_01550 [Undibacterium sp. 14-3-2]|uniref:hypothetical protein n=1 Tax=Undibacterium sp. 14-3-2 TaxID=2800129 RepID=UPI001906EC95|nr:hypothetical protein [Undibacterium sp. 14-3-2]MBK1888702.1 hypothetical protein [Undibacterium sp. 14-3-2]
MQFQLHKPLSFTRRTVALVLMLLVHGCLWLGWQNQHWISVRTEANEMRYLQLIDIQTPRIPEVSSAPPEKNLPTAPKRNNPTPLNNKPEKANTITLNPVVESNASVITPAVTSAEEPRLNLDDLKRSALAIDKQRQPGTIEKIQQSHRRDEGFEQKLADGTKKAERKDCLKAYSGIGLLAVIPLAVSTVVDTGCKW